MEYIEIDEQGERGVGIMAPAPSTERLVVIVGRTMAGTEQQD